MASTKLWKTLTNLIVEKTLTVRRGGRIDVVNPDGSVASRDMSAEILTATRQVLASENGRTFYLNAATEFVTTLPAPFLGAEFTFIVMAAPSGANYTVVTSASANILKGLQNSVAGDAGDSGTADDTVSFVGGQAVAGDKVELRSDGTSWFGYAISKVAAGITFTQASA